MKIKYKPIHGSKSRVKILSYFFDPEEEKEVSQEDARLILFNPNFQEVKEKAKDVLKSERVAKGSKETAKETKEKEAEF